MAAQSGHADMVRYLSDKGANVNIKDNDGVSEWDCCRLHFSVIGMLSGRAYMFSLGEYLLNWN